MLGKSPLPIGSIHLKTEIIRSKLLKIIMVLKGTLKDALHSPILIAIIITVKRMLDHMFNF